MARMFPSISPQTDPALAAPMLIPSAPPPMATPDPGTPPPADMGQPALPDAATAQPAPAMPSASPEVQQDASALNGPPSEPRHEAMLHSFDARKTANRADGATLTVRDPDYINKLLLNDAQHGQILQDEARYKEAHPWGSMESAHPGLGGKIGHVFGTIGNVLGNATLGAQNMSLIPGSQANIHQEEAQGAGEVKQAGAGLEQNALAGEQNAAASEAPSKIALNEAQAKKAGEDDKATKPEPIYDGAKNLIGFNTGTDLIGLHNPKLTPDMRDLIASAKSPEPKDADKTPPHITSMQNGQPHIMEREPTTGAYSIDRGIAPPNYAQAILPTKTITTQDENSIPQVMSWNSKTQRYDVPQGTSASGAYPHQMEQAGAIGRAANSLIESIKNNGKEVDKAKLGEWSTWVKKYGLDTPFADATLARIQAEYKSFADLNPALHGYRSAESAHSFEQLVGGLQKNPDAAIASIQGLVETGAKAINPNVQTNENTGGAPKATHRYNPATKTIEEIK